MRLRVAPLLNGVMETLYRLLDNENSSSDDVGVRGEQDDADEVEDVGETAPERSLNGGTSRDRSDDWSSLLRCRSARDTAKQDVENIGVETREDDDVHGSSSSGMICNVSLDDGICSRLRRGLCLGSKCREKTREPISMNDDKFTRDSLCVILLRYCRGQSE
jgi:hypothetical protein